MDAAIGLRAKTGRAIAVVLAGDPPLLLWRGELSLVDPKTDIGPYHRVMELPWSDAVVAVQPLVDAIEAIAERALRNVIADLESKYIFIRAVGVVGSPPRNIDRLGSPHIRAHAAEGILFRRVLELAAERNHLPYFAFADHELTAVALTMKKLGPPPWRIDERLAAAAAHQSMISDAMRRGC